MSSKVEKTMPKSWPGAFGVFSFSKQAIKRNLGTFIALWAITLVLSFVPNNKSEVNRMIIMQLASFAISCYLSAAMTTAYVQSVRGHKITLGETLNKALSLWLKFILAILATLILVVLSLVALIIPFFFVLPRLALIYYFVADKNMGPIQAVKASWKATKGHSAKVWGIYGVNLLMVLLLITIIGIPVAIYLIFMYSAAVAVLYEFVTKHKAKSPQLK